MVASAVLFGLWYIPPKPWLEAAGVTKTQVVELNLILGTADHYDLGRLGSTAFEQKDWELAAAAFGLAHAMAPEVYAYPANLALAEGYSCHCEAARRAFREATKRRTDADVSDSRDVGIAMLVMSCEEACKNMKTMKH